MAATETSTSPPLFRPLSRSQIVEKLNLCLKRRSTASTVTAKLSSAVLHLKKRKCLLCTPATTHPGPYRCAFHRRLANDKIEIISLKRKRRRLDEKIGLLGLRPKRKRGGGITTSDSGLNLRKTAMVNSLAGIGGVEAERCRKYLKESLVKPSSLRLCCRFRPRPRPSRFYALHKDQV